jgi:hypothetical protein
MVATVSAATSRRDDYDKAPECIHQQRAAEHPQELCYTIESTNTRKGGKASSDSLFKIYSPAKTLNAQQLALAQFLRGQNEHPREEIINECNASSPQKNTQNWAL